METSVGKVGVGETIELRTLLEFSAPAVQGVSWKQAHGHENCHLSLIHVLGIEPQVRLECRELLGIPPVTLDPELGSFIASRIYRILDDLLCVRNFKLWFSPLLGGRTEASLFVYLVCIFEVVFVD